MKKTKQTIDTDKKQTYLDEHRAIALARFAPKTFNAVGKLVEQGLSDEQILRAASTSGLDEELLPVVAGAIRHIRRQLQM